MEKPASSAKSANESKPKVYKDHIYINALACQFHLSIN